MISNVDIKFNFLCFLSFVREHKKYGLGQRRDFRQGNKLNMKSVYLLGKVSKSTLQCHQMSPAFPGRPFRHIKSGAKSASSTFFPSTHLHSQSRLDFEKHCCKMQSYFSDLQNDFTISHSFLHLSNLSFVHLSIKLPLLCIIINMG